jgi:ATP-dependent exoDNAse (exonuclease V) beta subunit
LPEPLSHSLNVAQQDQPSEPNIPEYEDPCARDAGIVFHRILQSLNSSTLLEAIQPTALIALKRMGYSGSKLQQGLDLVMLGLRNMLHDPRGQWILDPAHTQRHNEWALSVKTSQGVQNIIIDTTFIDNTGTRWIVDYKLAATDESEQYRAQLLKYRFALMALEKRSVRCGLYFPLLKAWSELSLDEEQYVETLS